MIMTLASQVLLFTNLVACNTRKAGLYRYTEQTTQTHSWRPKVFMMPFRSSRFAAEMVKSVLEG
jgi:hypothetical protein